MLDNLEQPPHPHSVLRQIALEESLQRSFHKILTSVTLIFIKFSPHYSHYSLTINFHNNSHLPNIFTNDCHLTNIGQSFSTNILSSSFSPFPTATKQLKPNHPPIWYKPFNAGHHKMDNFDIFLHLHAIISTISTWWTILIYFYTCMPSYPPHFLLGRALPLVQSCPNSIMSLSIQNEIN